MTTTQSCVMPESVFWWLLRYSHRCLILLFQAEIGGPGKRRGMLELKPAFETKEPSEEPRKPLRCRISVLELGWTPWEERLHHWNKSHAKNIKRNPDNSKFTHLATTLATDWRGAGHFGKTDKLHWQRERYHISLELCVSFLLSCGLFRSGLSYHMVFFFHILAWSVYFVFSLWRSTCFLSEHIYYSFSPLISLYFTLHLLLKFFSVRKGDGSGKSG